MTLRKLNWAKLTVFCYYGYILTLKKKTLYHHEEHSDQPEQEPPAPHHHQAAQRTFPFPLIPGARLTSPLFSTMLTQESFIEICVCQKTQEIKFLPLNAKERTLNFRLEKNRVSNPHPCYTEEAWSQPYVPPTSASRGAVS